ncbi:hypothetical protein D3C85_1310870 [compost metagenome]
MEATFRGVPARAVRQEEDADQQQNRRDDNHAQHPAPFTAVTERGIRQVCAEDTDGDHQLVHGDHAAANFLRRNFRQIKRGGIRRHADRQTEQHAGDNQHFDVRRSGGAQ